MSTVCPFILNNPPTENGKEGGVIMFKPGFIPRARQAAVVSKNALLYSAGVKREKVHHVIDRVAFYVA